MNYHKHYYKLIERAKNRPKTGYMEWHHIIPRCMKGSSKRSNMVWLTPEEHFVAHQLLVKMHPNDNKIVEAARMMTVNNNNERYNCRLYGWLKRRCAKISSERMKRTRLSHPWMNIMNTGNQYTKGTHWIHNPLTGEKRMIKDDIFS